jgi:hypothetical protein
VASSAIVDKIAEILSPGSLDFVAKKIIRENARKSDFHNIDTSGMSGLNQENFHAP